MKPTIGRIVHYYGDALADGSMPAPRAALVVELNANGDPNLIRLVVTDEFGNQYVVVCGASFTETPTPHEAAWPARV